MARLKTSSVRRLGLVILCMGISLSACSEAEDTSQALHMEATPDPVPVDLTSIEAQLHRYQGQQSFLNISAPHQGWHWLEAATVADNAGAADRLIEEADLFKLGPAASNLLYVLNPYRGLQVIDFSAGADHAQVVARTDATGNEPLEMYFMEQHQQLVIIERAYRDPYGQWLEQGYGHLLVYSVQEPSRPILLQKIELNGDVADSRRVGDVLYLTTSIWPSHQEKTAGTGKITSYQLTSSGLREITKLDLNLPVRSRESLEVISHQQDGQTRYYVTLTLSESRFGFGDRQSTIEVVDISDPQGKMQRLLQVSSKGLITQRSAVSIKDETLIVVSNYWQDFAGNEIRRVAVEGFRLPTLNSPRISLDEAYFRALWLEREMRRLDIDLETASKQGLLAHPDYGLQGIFVQTASGHLSKWLADSAALSGDTTGLHAQIQDVRFVEDLLYVFWVPENQIDPLDIFDISQPDLDISFLQRTYFDGWIERSIPLFYAGRHFILGLGWVLPADAAAAERRVQLMMFEVIKDTDGRVQTKILEQLTLQDSNVWANWSESDKTITVKFTDRARGTVLFPYYQWGNEIRQGGKLIGFDLAAGLSGQAAFFSEGALLTAPLTWLRRVFSNPEIDRLHILTDRALATYVEPVLDQQVAPEVVNSVQILELARDLRAYGIVDLGKTSYGIQILASDQYWQLAGAKTEIRLVPSKLADADQQLTLQSYQIDGSFKRMIIEGSTLYVLTLQTEALPGAAFDLSQDLWTLHRLALDQDTANLGLRSEQVSWERGSNASGSRLMISPWLVDDSQFLRVPGQALVVITDGEIRRIDQNAESFTTTYQDLSSCIQASAEEKRFHVLNQGLSVSYEIPVITPAHLQNVQLVRSYLLELQLNDAGLVCGQARNIPGRPLAQADATGLITQENRFLAWENYHQNSRALSDLGSMSYLSAHTAAVLISVELSSDHVSLKDLYGRDDVQARSLVHGKHLLLIEQPTSYGPHYLSLLSLDLDKKFQRQSRFIPDSFGDQSLELFASVENTSFGDLLILQKQQSILVYSLDLNDSELTPLGLRKVNADQSLSRVAKKQPIRHYYLDDRDARFVFDSAGQTLVFAEGLWGASQFVVGAIRR